MEQQQQKRTQKSEEGPQGLYDNTRIQRLYAL